MLENPAPFSLNFFPHGIFLQGKILPHSPLPQPYPQNQKNPPKSHRILTKITPSDSAYQRTLLYKFQASIYKNVEFCIFCQKADHGCVFICLFVVFFFVCVQRKLGAAVINKKNCKVFFLGAIII